MIYQTNGRELSLVEQKKLQWAKEKEEMLRLGEMFSATQTTTREVERTSIRTYYSNMDLAIQTQPDNFARSNHYYAQPNGNNSVISNSDHGYYYHHYEDLQNERLRSPSLPPIGRNKLRTKPMPLPRANITTDEDTSGYLSDSRNSPELWKSASDRSRSRFRLPDARGKLSPSKFSTHKLHNETDIANHSPNQAPYERNLLKQMQHDNFSDNKKRYFELNNQELMNALNKTNGMRMRDREQPHKKIIGGGVAAGQGRKLPSDGLTDNEHETDFSIPKTPSSSSSDGSRDYSVLSSYPDTNYRKDKEERAKWGDRGVTVGHFYDPIAKDENTKPGPGWLEKSLHDSEDESVRSYSFIRGQNAPIDANTLAERANRRLKAIEFQNAIKEQLAERERLKHVEEEKRLMEERAQEDRIRKHLQIEQERVEEEQKKQQEKMEQERKRNEIMKDAIEKAKQAAVLEKLKRKRDNAVSVVINNEIGTTEDVETPSIVPPNRLPALPFKPNAEPQESPRVDVEPDEEEAIKSELPKKVHPPVVDSHVVNNIDDGEKILIGSPIRLRKKTVNKSGLRKSSTHELDTNDITVDTSTGQAKKAQGRESDIDGIALVLQGMSPIVPALNNDLLSLNQNLNTMNNIQLAVMLAHQMQYFNPNINAMTMNGNLHQRPDHNITSMPPTPQSYTTASEITHKNHTVTEARSVNVVTQHVSEMEAHRDDDVEKVPTADGTSSIEITEREICKICEKRKRPQRSVSPTASNDFNAIVVSETPNDRTFTRSVNVNRRETTIETDTSLPSTAMSEADLYSVQSPPPSPSSLSTVDATTQTDHVSDSSCCCQHHQHHHHHVYVKEIATSRSPFRLKGGREDIQTIALDILTSKGTEIDGEPLHSMMNTPLRLKLTSDGKYEQKEPKEPIKLEDRPKWGVNRPVTQYVKASERDPVYLRNKRKKLKKRSSENADSGIDNSSTMISRSTSPSLVANCSQTIESSAKPKASKEKISRNICTEILPIKTDMNGRVYLNFHEASTFMSEDEVKRQIKSRHTTKERIMNRRNTSDEILRELKPRGSSELCVKDKLHRTRRSNTDVDLDA